MFFQEYEKLRKMGEGGFATVYKVRHARLGYVRALKVCNHVIDDESDPAWQTFLSECKVLLRIGNGSHPNIVRIYQPRLLDNHAVVEMDCVEGEPLTSYVRDHRFIPIDEFLRFARQIIGAVAYCHVDVYKFLMDPKEDGLELDPDDGRKYLVSPAKEQELVKKYGVVHNDLHSGNIIRRDYDGQYILLDFGLAIQNAHCVKSSSRFDGAIEYCSPEKLDRGEISTQSDVYALGVLLYEVLAGRVPFPYANGDGSSPESARSRVYMQHINEMPPPIYEIRKEAFESTHPGEAYRRDYPEALEALIMKCLEKKPGDRYDNAKSLLLAFEALLDRSGAATQPVFIPAGTPAGHTEEKKPEVRTTVSAGNEEIVRNIKKSVGRIVKPLSGPNTVEESRAAQDSGHKPQRPERQSNGVVVNLVWLLVLGATIGLGAICFTENQYVLYDESEIIGLATMAGGALLVLLPWMIKWESGFLNLLTVILWSGLVFASVFFSTPAAEVYDEEFDEYAFATMPDVENIPVPLLVAGFLALVGFCIAMAFSVPRRRKPRY